MVVQHSDVFILSEGKQPTADCYGVRVDQLLVGGIMFTLAVVGMHPRVASLLIWVGMVTVHSNERNEKLAI